MGFLKVIKNKRKRTEMKSSIYDQFQLEDQIKTNRNFRTEKIKGTKKK